MRDLQNCLWGDLQTDEERIEFLTSGRAWESGIIAPVLIPDVVNALRCRIAIADAIDYANNRETEWGSRAETCFAILYRALQPPDDIQSI